MAVTIVVLLKKRKLQRKAMAYSKAVADILSLGQLDGSAVYAEWAKAGPQKKHIGYAQIVARSL